MTADVHPFTPAGTTPTDQGVADQEPSSLDLMAERSVYLDAYLAPFKRWLDRDTVTEIMVNQPG
ncbi:MAG: P-type DNA transfer ATPase VirB11, partial [Erythrobacter sp.]